MNDIYNLMEINKIFSNDYSNYDELIVSKNDNIVIKKINQIKYPKKFTPNYNSSAYTPYLGKKHTIQSITKSIVSLLFGVAIHRGNLSIEILDEFIYKYFDQLSQTFVIHDVRN